MAADHAHAANTARFATPFLTRDRARALPCYPSYDQNTNPMNVFEDIRIPLMVLNAEDDPICHINNLEPWRDRMKTMDNVILVTTRKGSHCAHYEGWSARSWSARLMSDYFKSV